MAVIGFHSFPDGLGGGYYGIEVFFALSGFLITSLLLGERETTGRLDFRAFYLRRALRLFPALFAVVAAVWIATALAGEGPETATVSRDAPASILYVANWVYAYADTFPYGPLSHTWSLSIEEQYYIFWPLLLTGLLVLFSGRRRLAVAVVLAGVAASMAVRLWLFDSGSPLQRISLGTDTRAAPLLMGSALGMATTWWLGRATPAAINAIRVLGVVSLAVLVWMTVGPRYLPSVLAEHPARVYEEGLTIATVASVGSIAWVVTDPRGVLARLLSIRPLVWLGKISYGLYLWHVPIYVLLTPAFLGVSYYATQAVRILATVIVATASYYLLERPFLNLKRRYERRPDLAGKVNPRPRPAGS